jgi:GTPase SAR1 family protein
MAIIRPRTNEIHCKIVYYGPGRGGKTTNLIMIHKAVSRKVRGELISIETSGDRTIFFDFLPMDLGTIKNFNIKMSVYTVPGQVRYNDTRKLVLKGADGVVFVADSLEARRDQNKESLRNLEENFDDNRVRLSDVAVVLQYNKRDLDGGGSQVIMPVQAMQQDLNAELKWRYFEASALKGVGVKETFKAICMLTVTRVSAQLLMGDS